MKWASFASLIVHRMGYPLAHAREHRVVSAIVAGG